ncbi:hypothetical protein [Paludisphaera sp.]|uniref:helix-turn-helix transcriptional regulator n=1 Tax=Paludisphaera sp. TaxID=2017432 RepID=UPI00301DD508
MGAQRQQEKVAVSVSEMARMVGMSRARFYQLMAHGCFPRPSYDPDTGRPYFEEAQQLVCLDVRRRNCGIDGKPILFYARRVEIRPADPRTRRPAEGKARRVEPDDHADLIDAVKSLGLASATSAQVKAAVAELFPLGVAGIDQGEVIKKVFVHLKRRNPADNVR